MKLKLDAQALSAGLNRGAAEVQNRSLSDKQARLQRTQQALQDATVSAAPAPITPGLPSATAPASGTAPDGALLLPAGASKQYLAFCSKHAYRPGQTIAWPVDQIEPNPDNPRAFYDDTTVKSLAVSVASTGLGEVIKTTVHESDPDRLVLWDGERRLRAAKHLGQSTIEVKVDDLKSPLERYLAGRALNIERDGQTCLDDAIAWQRLLDHGHVENREQLANLMNVSASEISMTLAVGKMPRPVLELMAMRRDGGESEKFGLTMAYEVSRYFSEHGMDKTTKLVHKIREEDLPLSKVREIVRSQNGGKSARQRQRYDQRFEFKVGEKNMGSIKMYGTNSLKLELLALETEAREDLYKKIKELVSQSIGG